MSVKHLTAISNAVNNKNNRSLFKKDHYQAVFTGICSDPGNRKREKQTSKQSLLPGSCFTSEIHPITTNEHAGTSKRSWPKPAPGIELQIDGLVSHHVSKYPQKETITTSRDGSI